MTPLRQRMLEDLQIRRYSLTTIRIYLRCIAEFAQHFGKPPDQLGAEHIRLYQLFLIKEKKVSPSTYIQMVCALRFFYTHTLDQKIAIHRIPFPRRERKLPLILSCAEVQRLIQASSSLRHRALLAIMYGSGLRVSEVAQLKVKDIDSTRQDHSCKKQLISPGQLTIHADRGSSMKFKPVALLMADLGVTKTHSRAHVSDDNPYSESQFRTLKYRPGFPDRFGSIEDARGFCQTFFRWYNLEHHHSGLGLMTPAVVHHGKAADLLLHRQSVLDTAFRAHPERFVRQPPKPPALPTAVWINKPKNEENTP